MARDRSPVAAPRGATLLAIYGLLCGFAISPLLWASVPPLVDYPNHLARMWVLVHGAQTPALAENYTVHWRILPYLGMDAVVVALSWLMPVEIAGRVFIAITMLSLVGGTVALHRVLFGRIGLWPLASLLFLYNFILFFGFLSCLFALGLSLLGLAAWIATRSWPAIRRMACFSLFASAIVLSHLFGFGVYGLLVVGYDLGDRLAGRRRSIPDLVRLFRDWLHFIPALALAYVGMSGAVPSYTSYGGIAVKLAALWAPFNADHTPQPVDLVMTSVGLIFVILMILAGKFRMAPTMRWPLLLVVAAAVAMPDWLSGSWGVDFRLPAFLPFVLIASIRIDTMRVGSRWSLCLVAFVLLSLRTLSLSAIYARYDDWFEEFRHASVVIPVGARLLPVEATSGGKGRPLPGFLHLLGDVQTVAFNAMPALAVIDRSIYFPFFFAVRTTVEVTSRNQAISESAGASMTAQELLDSADPAKLAVMGRKPNLDGELPYWHDWPRDFDYVVWMAFDDTPRPKLANLVEVARGSYFSIYKIVR